MLRIERAIDAGEVRLVLSGRIEGDDRATLERAIARETVPPHAVTLDMAEVRLLDRDAVRFLVACETAGIRLARVPAYVREWMKREGS